MSHIVTVRETEYTNMDAMKAAADSLGLRFTEGGAARFYFGVQPCDYVLHLPGSYDIGFRRNAGKMEMVCDGELLIPGHLRGRTAQEIIGADGGVLKQHYNTAVMEIEFAAQGIMTERSVDASTGEILLVALT